jgi:phospholipid/cholesterol/gamma-HCH transport system ATP-binding protein
VIKAQAVRMSFGAKQVLDDFSLDIEERRTTVIIGRSGIGKSVFLKCVCGLLRPQGGSIRVDDEEITSAGRKDLLRIRSKIGMLFQEGALFDSMTVFQNIAFPLAYKHRFSKAEIERRVLKYADLVEMREAVNLIPKELSGGMKRKVAIARAMINEPKYLFYDEPTTGLDPSSSAIVEIMIKRLQDEQAITSVIVSHDIELAAFAGDTIALLEGGKIVAAEPKERAFASDSDINQSFLISRKRIRREHGFQDDN